MEKITPQLLVQWFLKDFIKIVIIGLTFAVASVFLALSLPNEYSVKAKVVSNLSDAKSLSGNLSGLGGLASLAGVSIGGGSSLTPEVLTEMLNSSSFLASFIRQYQLEKEVMAAIEFIPSKNQFKYDEKLLDVSTGKWIREFEYPQKQDPSDAELVEKFKESFSAEFDRKSKIIMINFTSLSPSFSKKVSDNVIYHFNQYMKNKDIEESETSIKYLQGELELAKFHEVKQALQQVMEEQLKKLSLANTRDEYALRFVQYPIEPTKKSGPKRALICVAVTVGGTMLSILLLWSIRIFRA